MKYYFSSPSPRKKQLIDSGAKRFLLSYAVDGNQAQKHFGEFDDVIIDSGAFTVWNKQKGEIDIEKYSSFLSNMPESWHFINLDVIPKTGSSKKEIDLCIEKSFENFLFLKSKRDKIIPVHHYGENLSVLSRYLQHTNFVAISPANDTAEKVKREYLTQIYKFIDFKKIKTHALGYSSFEGMKLFPFYSVDSISYARFFIGETQYLSSDAFSFFQMREIQKFIRYEEFLTKLWAERGVVYE